MFKKNSEQFTVTLKRSLTLVPAVLSPIAFGAVEVYGFSFVDMEVDFDRKEVLVKPMMNIVLGLDKPLLPTKAFIHSDNPDLNFLINQLNRSLSLFEKVCVGAKNEIRYAKFFPKRKT